MAESSAKRRERAVWIVELAWRKGYSKPGWDPDYNAVFSSRVAALASIAEDDRASLIKMRAVKYIPAPTKRRRKR